MSFDPHGYDQDPQPPPPAGSSGFTDTPGGAGPLPVSQEAALRAARDRVMLPGIFLIIVGALNLAWVVGTAFYAVQARLTPEETLRQQMLQTPNGKQQLDELAKQGYTLGDVKRMLETGSWILSGGSLVFAILIVIGGIRMLQLRNWGLAIFASLLAGIPCLSGPVCCCGAGDLIAIWCLVVLLQNDVRSAFR